VEFSLSGRRFHTDAASLPQAQRFTSGWAIQTAGWPEYNPREMARHGAYLTKNHLATFLPGNWDGNSFMIGRHFHHLRITGALVAACFLTAGAAATQTASATNPAESDSQLQEIIVTAEKRESSLQTTPISMTVFNGAALQSAGISNIAALAPPGVSFRSSGPGQTEIEMRGLNSAGGTSPTVGFYLDEVALTPPAASLNGKIVLDPNLFDLKQIEILRGPQGTLYGSGSMGGTVRLITNAPDPSHFSVNVQGIASGTADGGGLNRTENLAVNLPVIQDVLGVRIVVGDTFQDGWINRIVAQPFPLESNPTCPGFYGCTRGNVAAAPVTADFRYSNSYEIKSARISALYIPTDGLTVLPLVMAQGTTAKGPSQIDSDPGTNAHYQPFNVPEPLMDNFFLAGLTVEYRFPEFTLTSVTADWHRQQQQTQDFSEPMQDLFEFPAYEILAGGAGAANITDTDRTSQFSQELRMTSTWTGPFRALVGGYFSKFYSESDSNSQVPSLIPFFGTGNINIVYFPTHLQQEAVFGDFTYQISPSLAFTAGARYYDYKTTFVNTQSGIATASLLSPLTLTGAASADGLNPKFNLSFTPTDNAFLYATVTKGFRPGAGNVPVPTSGGASCASSLATLGLTNAPGQYAPDTVWSYELGSKLQFFDRRLTIDGAIYYENWNGVQQAIALSCGFDFTENAGDAHVYGGELEIQARLTDNLSFSLGGGYTHAAFTADNPATGVIRGQQLQNVPPYTENSAITYRRDIGASVTFVAGINNQFVDARHDVLGPLPAYDVINAQVGAERGPWRIYLFGNNVTDKKILISDDNSLSLNIPSYNRISEGIPLTIGINLNYKFSN
jgi:iron complex outermembrane recepter protein